MSTKNRRELEATRQKFAWLENEYAAAKSQPAANARVQELTVRSLKAMINQMKEEIARFESAIGAAPRNS